MDPISITGTVLAITAKCLTTARTLYTLREKYKDAQLTITAIYSESRVIGASLSHIQSIILESPEVLHSNLQTRPELESIFDHALTGCMLVFSVLDEEVEKLNNNVESAWNRATAVWKEDTMKDLLQQIRGQQIAISLLIQVLQMESMSDIRGLLQKNSGALQMVRQESHRLRSTHPKVNAPESIFESPFDDLASLDTTLTPTAFTFDDDVINSKAYRMALTKPTSQRKDLSSTDLGAPGTESDQRNAVLRSLLREREDESIRLREQIETLSRSNSSLSARLKENEERYSAKSAETTRRIAEIEKMRSEIEMASKREAKINTSLQKMEKAFSKKGKTSIFSLSRDAPDAEPRRPSPKIWVFAGVNNADNAVQICIKKGIIKEGISDEDDMIIIFMNEESLAETKNDMGRELLAIYESRKSLGSYNQHIQEEQLALVIGEKSAKHLSDEYVNLLLVTLMMYTTVIVFWSRDPMSIEIENYLHQVNQPVKQESDFVIWNDNFLAKLNHHSYHQDQSSKAVTDQIRALHEVAKNKQTS